MDGSLPPPPQHHSYENWVDQVPVAPSKQHRPGAVTVAAVLLMVSAAYSILGGLVLIGFRGQAAGRFGTASPRSLAVFLLALGLLDLLAGILVVLQRRGGRVFAMVLAGVGVLGALAQFGRAPSSGLVSLAINGFILYALAVNGDAFNR